MNVWPLRFREINDDAMIVADESGGWFRSDPAFVQRYACDELTDPDEKYLRSRGHAFKSKDDLSYQSFLYRFAKRQYTPKSLSYLILVPTLRCNLNWLLECPRSFGIPASAPTGLTWLVWRRSGASKGSTLGAANFLFET